MSDVLTQLQYWDNKEPKCPHCGADFALWGTDHALDLNYDDGGQTTFECRSCRKEFVCVTAVHYGFSTAVSEEAADDENWGPQKEATSLVD